MMAWVPFRGIRGQGKEGTKTSAQLGSVYQAHPGWRAAFTSAPAKSFTHALALSAHSTLQTGICGGPFHRGRSRHREAKCLSSRDSANKRPVLAHTILPSIHPAACPWR